MDLGKIIFNKMNVNIYIKFNHLFNDIKKLNYFLRICNDGILINKKKFKKIKNPKISVISTCYNSEKYILRLIRSIQNQCFEDIEIILVDDYSNDNTVKLIEKYQKEDERIILIKHKENKGTLISRNDGILFSKGKFLLIPDGDDIFSDGLFNLIYKIAIEKNIDIIKFNVYFGKRNYENLSQFFPNITVCQPELFGLIFFGNYNKKNLDVNLWNKLIKRDTYLKALKFIDNFYLNQYMIYYEDALINIMLYKKSKKFYFLNIIGYYYIHNDNSMMHKYIINANKSVKSFFIFLKFVFQYIENSKLENDIIYYILTRIYIELNIDELYKYITKDFAFYYEIIKLYLKSPKISNESKNVVQKIKSLIEKVENSLIL